MSRLERRLGAMAQDELDRWVGRQDAMLLVFLGVVLGFVLALVLFLALA